MVTDSFQDISAIENRSSDEEDAAAALEDEDTCSALELEQSVALKYKIADESAVTLKKEYILSLCSDSTFSHIAAGLSDASVQLFNISEQRGLSHAAIDCIPAPTTVSAENRTNVCGVRFLDETPNTLLIGTTNGQVRLYDLRSAEKEQACFQLDTENNEIGAPQSISCFDRNANGRILCCGTEKFMHNVFLLFYDVRERKQIGGYFESHEDDVTTVKFHAVNPDLLCSGSTDGLINIFDINETCEDDALQTTINTESSVHKLNWLRNVYEKDIISCVTHTNDFKLYDCEEGDLVTEFERPAIVDAMKRKNPANFNLIDAHATADGETFLLAGTNFNKGEVLRSLRIKNKELKLLADFEGNKQIVRESVFDSKSNCIVTAGESGIVSLWTPSISEKAAAPSANSTLKMKTKMKTKKITPY